MMQGDKPSSATGTSDDYDREKAVLHLCDPTTNNSMPDVVVGVGGSGSSSGNLKGMKELTAETGVLKRPKSAYMLFQEKKRDEVIKSLGPDASFPAVATEIARMWKALSKSETLQWLVLAEEQKRIYLQQKENSATNITDNNMAEAHPEEDNSGILEAQKRPMPAYFLFAREKRDEVRKSLGPSAQEHAVTLHLARMWKEMSALDKKPFMDLSEQQKKQFLATKKGSKPEPLEEDAEESSEEESPMKPIKRKKAKKDPNHPKRPRSAYMIFAEDRRPGLVATTPGMRPVECMKKLGEMWKSMSPEDKQPFFAKAEADKQRYQKDMEEYNLSLANKPEAAALPEKEVTTTATVPSKRRGGGRHRPASSPSSSDSDNKEKEDAEESSEEESSKKPRRIQKDPNRPKRPMSAYILFVGDRRPGLVAATPGMRPVEYMKKLGEMWKSMSPEDKQPFVAKAEAEKQRYQKDMEEYNLSLANKTEEGATATTCAATVPSKRIGGDPSSSDSDSDTTEKPIRKHIKLDPNQPKRAKTAYMLFCEHRLPQMKESQPTMNVCERIKTIGAEWKALTQQEKQPFVDQAQADKLRYQNDMKAYNASQNP